MINIIIVVMELVPKQTPIVVVMVTKDTEQPGLVQSSGGTEQDG